MSAEVRTRPVGPSDLPRLAELFESSRNTRRCWCMASCTTRGQFALGWLTGGNRKRFDAVARQTSAPMGVLASTADTPVGWCACGPRSRYVAATAAANPIMAARVPAEDDAVWLVPCLFVRADHRGRGITHTLVRAAVELARRQGAPAIEGWPLSRTQGSSADAFVGREQVFASVGFTVIDRPSPERVIMRLELGRTG